MPRNMDKLSGYSKPKNPLRTLWRLLSYFKNCRSTIVLALIAIVVYSAATIGASYCMKPLVTFMEVNGITPNEAYAKCVALLIGMAFIYVTAVITNYLLNLLMLKCSTQIQQDLRIEMFSHMQDMPIRFFDARTHGELMSYYTNDIDAVSDLLRNSITQMLISSTSLVGTIALMLVLSPGLFLIMVVLAIVDIFLVRKIGSASSKNYKAQQQAVSKVNGYIEEMVSGQREVKVFTREEQVMDNFDPMNRELRSRAKNAVTFASIMGPIMNNLSHIFYAITTAVGVLLLTGESAAGILIAFLQYIRNFADRVSQISEQFNAIVLALAGAERVFGIIDTPTEEDQGNVTLVNVQPNRENEIQLVETKYHTDRWAWKVPDPENTGAFSLVELKGDVQFYDVTFSYDGKKVVLKNVSLYAKPGQKIAFVGSTGAGKTTITNLINRFYDIEQGTITYDGIDIKDIRKADLRRSLGMVLQDTHLFTGTVMENIRYGRIDATDEECVEAAKIANAHYFITRLPQGYDTMIHSDGANLSQGQRQLLAIARAAVSNPPVLILDEATSSVDTRTEKLIERGMDELMAGRTVFVIAHRLSTVRNANAIMVLENGNIIERGDHPDLLEAKGRYYQLYTGMFELS